MAETQALLSALSKLIRKRREELGLSQTELAERAGLHRTYICNIERGTQNLSLESLNNIAGSLEIPVARLIGEAEESAEKKSGLIRILLIEDNPADVFVFKRCLKNSSHKTTLTVVDSGLKAFQLIGRAADKTGDKPGTALAEIVFLDLNLPGKSGHDLLKAFKQNERLRHIPVVILTTSSNPLDVKMTYGSYANSYLSKPVDPAEFERSINSVLDYWFGTSALPSPD
ncbi:MAG: response regulator [Candidatus Melainabacteria bacterium]|nr:response regulator [Candidatus Melainabacteria bacterium]